VPDEPTRPDLEERDRRFGELFSRGEVDTAAAMFAPDAVWITADFEGRFEGREAIRELIDGFVESFEDIEHETQEFRYLGSGATFSVIVQRGRANGSAVLVERLTAAVVLWNKELVQQLTTYTDIDKGRTAAEQLARERG
jgi:ketosteroid isomerase-like protein